jgi:integrase
VAHFSVKKPAQFWVKINSKALLCDLQPRHVKANLEPLTPAVASTRRKAWRKLAEFWETSGMTKINVADGVKRKKLPKTDGFLEWTGADLAVFRAHWPIDTPQRLAMELLQWTGARCIDAVTLGPQKIGRDGVLTFRQSKTGVEAYVPWQGPAFGLEAQRGDLLICTAKTTALVWTLTNYGKPRTQAGFSQWFSKAATEAGLPHLSAHGLRKYRMNQLAESGVPLLAMQAWVGHTTLDEVQHYTARADRKKAISGTNIVNLNK